MAAPKRILVIDDEESVREVVEAQLAAAGYEVETAGGADTGLRLLAGGAFDLVVCDLNLPGMQGGELLEKSGRSDVPAVFMSGFVDMAFAGDRGGNKGARYLQKPVLREDLLSAVRAALEG